ncbi:MAG TPA: hypothetical protein VHU82_04595 [Vicinamibacterales bacterium]|nr:hypothetical protein [Vicinamibacterales bacterium]
MGAQRWTFLRGDTRLDLSREETRTGVNLIVVSGGVSRAFSFADIERLVQFQSDMESLLVRTGWSLSQFAPERRAGGERRHFPRLTERRRWWTDTVRLFTAPAKTPKSL